MQFGLRDFVRCKVGAALAIYTVSGEFLGDSLGGCRNYVQ